METVKVVWGEEGHWGEAGHKLKKFVFVAGKLQMEDLMSA